MGLVRDGSPPYPAEKREEYGGSPTYLAGKRQVPHIYGWGEDGWSRGSIPT